MVFEWSKWENDPYCGREPGPDENYSGEWPTLEQELGAYITMGIKLVDIPDPVLRLAYKKHRQLVKAQTIARKSSPAS